MRKLNVERGEKIDKKKLLFEIDSTELNAIISGIKADIQEAQAQLKAEKAEFERGEKLISKQAISYSDHDAREAKYKETLAKIRRLTQDLIRSEKKIYDSKPTSLYKAYAQEVFFRPGEYIEAGKPAVSLLSHKNTKVRFFVPQNQIHKVKIGQKVSVFYDGQDKPVAAKINYISQELEYTPPIIYSLSAREKLMFLVEAKPQNIPSHFRPGLPVDIKMD